MDKDAKGELRERAFLMWLACHTQEEIAEAVGYSRQAIGSFLESFATKQESPFSDISDSKSGRTVSASDSEDGEEQEDYAANRMAEPEAAYHHAEGGEGSKRAKATARLGDEELVTR